MIYAILLNLALQAAVPDAIQSEEAGAAAAREGQTDATIMQLRKAIDLAPDQAAGYFKLGVAYSLKRDYGEAVPLLKKAV